uniref:outer membrane beta-barrel protein n=1 Tax=Gelidibacter sp. TaxID=2018083 RepID=UPI004049CDEC
MKKLVCITALAFLVFSNANAQDSNDATGGFAKGDIFFSGTANYTSSKTDDVKDETFAFIPRVGFFVADNIVIGGQVGYGFSKEKFDGEEVGNDQLFIVGAFARYYNKPANQFSLFGQLSVDYLSLNDKISDAKATGFGVTIAPGISYFVSDNFALEATVGLLSYNSVKPDGGESTNTFDTGLDFSNVSFGLVYKL